MSLFRKRQVELDAETGIMVTTNKEPTRFANAMAATFATTSKQLVWVYTINGIARIWCSYILAFMGREQIAESLSSNVCSVVIGQIGFYLVTKTVENIFKYNSLIGPWGVGVKPKEENENEQFSEPEPVFAEPVQGFDDLGTEGVQSDDTAVG